MANPQVSQEFKRAKDALRSALAEINSLAKMLPAFSSKLASLAGHDAGESLQAFKKIKNGIEITVVSCLGALYNLHNGLRLVICVIEAAPDAAVDDHYAHLAEVLQELAQQAERNPAPQIPRVTHADVNEVASEGAGRIEKKKKSGENLGDDIQTATQRATVAGVVVAGVVMSGALVVDALGGMGAASASAAAWLSSMGLGAAALVTSRAMLGTNKSNIATNEARASTEALKLVTDEATQMVDSFLSMYENVATVRMSLAAACSVWLEQLQQQRQAQAAPDSGSGAAPAPGLAQPGPSPASPATGASGATPAAALTEFRTAFRLHFNNSMIYDKQYDPYPRISMLVKEGTVCVVPSLPSLRSEGGYALGCEDRAIGCSEGATDDTLQPQMGNTAGADQQPPLGFIRSITTKMPVKLIGLLQSHKEAAYITWADAKCCLDKEDIDRNKLAEAAAKEYRDWAERLLGMATAHGDPYEVVDEVVKSLRGHLSHAEEWEGKFRDWERGNLLNKYKHAYATFVHGLAGSRYKQLLEDITALF